VKVVPLRPELEPSWNEFVASRDAALFYASLEFRDLLARVLLNARPHYLLALDGDRVCGVLPAFAAHHPTLGKVLNSLPYYGSNGGFVTDGRAETAQALLAAYLHLESSIGCVASTLVSSPFDGERVEYEKGLAATFRDNRIGQVTPLPSPSASMEDELFALYDDTARRNVRKARKSGVTWETRRDFDAFLYLHRTHAKNIHAVGGLPKELAFFRAVADGISEKHWRLYVANSDEQPIGALLVFRFNRTVEYYTPAISEDFRPLQPLSLLVHEAMREAASDGYRWWNWGGTWRSQTGVYRFKRKWGAVDMPYHYYTRITDRTLLGRTRSELLEAFPHFFVLPFEQLAPEPNVFSVSP